ncbi:hypothetical protein C3L33_01780, partial [Rhododendron williamsianum]
MEIDFGDQKQPFDIDFHPSNPIFAAGLITGDLLLVLEVNAHSESCRATRFINDGQVMVWVCRDAVNRIINLTESTIASGDDEGCVKLQTRSEFSEEELLSVVIMKNGRKVICGSQSGTLLLYSWGFFKDCSDRFVDLSGNPVDALLKLDEERVIAGSGNGLISLVGILPNRIIQPIAQHSENNAVERLAFSHDKKYLGSISDDNTLKACGSLSLLCSANTLNSHGAVVDSDSDGANEMDMDDSLPKSSKVIVFHLKCRMWHD